MSDDQKFYCQEASCNGPVLEENWNAGGSEGKKRHECPDCGWNCTDEVAKRFCAKRPKHHKADAKGAAALKAEREADAAIQPEDEAYERLKVLPDNQAEALRQRVLQLERELAARDAEDALPKKAGKQEKAVKAKLKAEVAAHPAEATVGVSGRPGLQTADESESERNAMGPNPLSSTSWSSGPGSSGGPFGNR